MNLLHPEADALEHSLAARPLPLSPTAAVSVYRALPGIYLGRFQSQGCTCSQTAKPNADVLRQRGYDPLAEPGPSELAIVFATKHKEEVLLHIARAAAGLAEGGWLLVSVANELGAASLERRCAAVFGAVESHSKHKCRVFRLRKDSARLDRAELERWRRQGDWQWLAETGLYSRAGLFSWKTIDRGSRLLADWLPLDLHGQGADLGVGTGFLSRELLGRCRGIGELHLVDAEHLALLAAQRNLAEVARDIRLHTHWLDVTAGLPLRQLDFVVMNPPFHSGRDSLPGLGRAFITAALGALRPGGRLLLVANRHLPYAAEITARGGEIVRQSEAEGFRLIEARRRKAGP